MKKYLSLLIVALMLIIFLVSCSTAQNGSDVNPSNSSVTQDNTDLSGSTIDSSIQNSQSPNNCEHMWVQNDADQCEYLEVCVLCKDKRGEDIPHIYFDEKGNCLERCLNCGKQNVQHTPPEQTNSVTWQFGYAYWYSFETLTGEPYAELLLDGGILGNGFNNIVIPNDITAGDTITIEYTGYIEIMESFPTRIRLQEGEVKSYSFNYADVVYLEGESLTHELLKSEYDFQKPYVILDKNGSFVSLDEFKIRNGIYLVLDQEKMANLSVSDGTPLPIACALAYNPRDIEGGTSSEKITVERAIEIAEYDFYFNYAEDGVGFEYSMDTPNLMEGYWEICFKKVYTSGKQISYHYTIHSTTGEIVSMETKEYLPPEKINTVTWQFNYDYGFHKEGVVTLLVDYGKLRDDFERIIIPNDIVAGDTITISYTGSYIVEETYPSHIGLNGDVISYSFSYASVIPMRTKNLTGEMLLDYDAPNNYVILDRSGRYTTLDKYEGEKVYLVEDRRTVGARTEDTPFYVACMLAYNPRDLDDGVPKHENISESEAIKIANNHYYYTYFVNYEESFEYETSRPESLEGYWEVRISEYFGRIYYYTIDKITGEIVSMAIDE